MMYNRIKIRKTEGLKRNRGKIAKRILCSLTVFAAIGILGVPGKELSFVQAASAKAGDLLVSGSGLTSADYSYDNHTLHIKSGKEMTISGTTSMDHICIDSGVDASLVFENLSIDMHAGDVKSPAVQIADHSNGKVNIVLKKDNVLYGYYGSGIQKNGTEGTLTLSGDGTLKVTSMGFSAAIGSSKGFDTGNIVIAGGTIDAFGYYNGAGIGGGENGNAQNITIEGGTVKAVSQFGGAGIGGGYQGKGSGIQIKDGSITARNSYAGSNFGYGAAIGGGYGADGENIAVSGGSIDIYFYQESNAPSGAGIGGGAYGAGKNITISDGKVKIYTVDGVATCYGGAGIGGGCGADGSDITILGGDVFVKGGQDASGIGGGYKGLGKNIRIQGGKVSVKACSTGNVNQYGGAGIGGGGSNNGKRNGNGDKENDISDVTILGGTVTASGGKGAAGIGESYTYKGKVYISGGSVNAVEGSRSEQNTSADAVGSGAAGQNGKKPEAEVVFNASMPQKKVRLQVYDGYTAGQQVVPKLKDTAHSNQEYSGYGSRDLFADAQGRIYLYLEDGIVLKKDTEQELPGTTEQNTTEQNTTEERTTEQNTTEERTTEQNTTEGGRTEQSTTEERTTEQGTTEEKKTEHSTTEGGKTEQSTTDERKTEQKTTEAGMTEQKKTEMPGVPMIGSRYCYNGSYYKIMTSSSSGGTVEYAGPEHKKTKKITIPNSITIGNAVYKVTAVRAGACSGCTKLTGIVIGSNVEGIGAKAFYGCKSLTAVTIPKNVKTIGKQAFAKCSRLKKITIKTQKLTGKRIGSKAFYGIKNTAVIKVPRAKLKEYKKVLRARGVSARAKIKK